MLGIINKPNFNNEILIDGIGVSMKFSDGSCISGIIEECDSNELHLCYHNNSKVVSKKITISEFVDKNMSIDILSCSSFGIINVSDVVCATRRVGEAILEAYIGIVTKISREGYDICIYNQYDNMFSDDVYFKKNSDYEVRVLTGGATND